MEQLRIEKEQLRKLEIIEKEHLHELEIIEKKHLLVGKISKLTSENLRIYDSSNHPTTQAQIQLNVRHSPDLAVKLAVLRVVMDQMEILEYPFRQIRKIKTVPPILRAL